MSDPMASITGQFPFWRQAALPPALPPESRLRVVTGCGTSYNLALSVAAALNEAGQGAIAVPAGEWTTRPQSHAAGRDALVIALSRSGETTETVAAATASRTRGHDVLALTCAAGSALAQAATRAVEMATHRDEGIVMTASASLMLRAGLALAGFVADDALMDRAEALLGSLDAATLNDRRHVVFLGGGALYGVALEGALKLQEMAICFTQAFHPGEHRHGPVSLIDDGSAVVILYGADPTDEARLSAELRAKGAFVLGLGGPGDESLPVGAAGPLAGLEMLPVLQLLGERYARAKGVDTRQPRHLTKVVVL